MPFLPFDQFSIFNDSLLSGHWGDFYSSCHLTAQDFMPGSHWAALQHSVDQGFTFSRFYLLKEISDTNLNHGVNN